MKIDFTNLEMHHIPVDKYIGKWIFEDEDGKMPSDEHKDQIFPLTNEASKFLWDFEMQTHILSSEKYFKSISFFKSQYSDQKSIKKYLFNLGIPFANKVFIPYQPDTGYVLTWKMVIKYSHNLFWANDQTVWDKTLNWKLDFHHDGEFIFGKDLIYDGQIEAVNLANTLKEIEKRKQQTTDNK